MTPDSIHLVAPAFGGRCLNCPYLTSLVVDSTWIASRMILLEHQAIILQADECSHGDRQYVNKLYAINL